MPLRFREKQLNVTRTDTGGVTFYMVEDAASRVQHRLYEMEYEVAQLLDGSRSPEKVAKLVNKRRRTSLLALDVEKFAAQLQALGFVVDER